MSIPAIRTQGLGKRYGSRDALADLTRPDLLLLDEPTSGLDPLMEQAFRRPPPISG
jgi:ABC-2 type transport system ATP-binding protein